MSKASSAPLSSPPPHFPSAGVTYLTAPRPSARLPKSSIKTYCSPCPPSLLPNAPPKLAIRAITNRAHPAFGQHGLFALQRVERGTWLRDYLGLVHTEAEKDPASNYDLSLDRRVTRDGSVEVTGIDATKWGNETRFVNDYRGGVAERPNAVFELRRWPLSGKKDDRDSEMGIRMAVWAGPKGIQKGDEICVSYGRGFWAERRREAQALEENTGMS